VTPDRCTCNPPTLDLDCPVHGQQISEVLAQPPRPASRCELCAAITQTRPYGPDGEDVCLDCVMKDQAAAARGFEKRFGFAPGDA
jgi:hypothetical protein